MLSVLQHKMEDEGLLGDYKIFPWEILELSILSYEENESGSELR